MHLSPLALAMPQPDVPAVDPASPSPSKKNPALVKVGPGRIYRYDPYRCAVTSPARLSQARRSPTKAIDFDYGSASAALLAVEAAYHEEQFALANEAAFREQCAYAAEEAAYLEQCSQTFTSGYDCDGFAVEGVSSLSSTATAATAAPVPSVSAASESGESAAAPEVRPSVPRYALVSFKHEACRFRAPFRVSPGDCVVVEADRGEHFGIVEEVSTEKPRRAISSKLLRHASPQEIGLAADNLNRETTLLPKVQRMSESVGLGIKVVDVEFQYDMNKLTVFYSAKNFVDFRKLQRQLFRLHRCRIWLINWDEVRPYVSSFPRPE